MKHPIGLLGTEGYEYLNKKGALKASGGGYRAYGSGCHTQCKHHSNCPKPSGQLRGQLLCSAKQGSRLRSHRRPGARKASASFTKSRVYLAATAPALSHTKPRDNQSSNKEPQREVSERRALVRTPGYKDPSFKNPEEGITNLKRLPTKPSEKKECSCQGQMSLTSRNRPTRTGKPECEVAS